ncbi:hypothetical protein [Lentilactobacillus sp. Marseille-Q4993]|uniref:hypothetical protein n=1 Tax=Lentilactobacillus sp. Marseille-Q4993 TaxID=3039492 RepID=UPI0024BCAF0B|nr:hypothetical protein [Lentilactobacillus sp. Marseille-Q4993]
MNKKLLSGVFILSLAGVIAGCGNNSSNKKDSSSKDSLSANMKNSSSNSSSEASESSNLNSYSYSVPKKDKQKSNYVANGNLKSKKQFTYDKFGTKQNLSHISVPKIKTASGKVSYQINRVKVVKNQPATKEAKQAAAAALNLPNVPDTYYTFVISYSVTNRYSKTIALNGVDAVKTDAGQTLNTANQLSDPSAGQKLAANQSRRFVMVGYLYNYDSNPAKLLKVKFGAVYTTGGTKVVNGPENPINISL